MSAPTRDMTRWQLLQNRAIVFVGGLGLIAFGVVLVDAVWSIWPAIEEVSRRGGLEVGSELSPLPHVRLFLVNVDLAISEGQAYLILVTVFGMLGSFIYTATSFTTYVGNEKFELSWVFWYLLCPFIGGAVALVLIFSILGGLVTLSANGSDFDPRALNPYTVSAFSALAGWFSKAASDKVFDLILKNSKDKSRDDKLASADLVDRRTSKARLGGCLRRCEYRRTRVWSGRRGDKPLACDVHFTRPHRLTSSHSIE